MRVDLAKKAFKDLYVNKGLHWVNDHFDWFVKTYSNLLASEMGKQNTEVWREECRAKQEAGVKFECLQTSGNWVVRKWCFDGPKEYYREVQEYPVTPKVAAMGIEPIPPTPHAAERALWKAQREAGTNEVWQFMGIGNVWLDCAECKEPEWLVACQYRVKPMKLTAKIARREVYKTPYDWEFTGTREEYRAECEKYGYVVISEIKEVAEKPKTVKYYFVLFKTPDGRVGTGRHKDKQKLTDYWVKKWGYTIIGDIESREVEV